MKKTGVTIFIDMIQSNNILLAALTFYQALLFSSDKLSS